MVLLGSGQPGLINQSNSLLDVFYQEIKHRMLLGNIGNHTSGSSTTCLTLLCHTDLDAICTLRILVALLKSDSIPYEIIPVAGYSDLKQIDTSNMQSVVCINVGGMVNLIDFFDLPSNPTSKWWVLDSHRPLNLHNLFSSAQVVVIDDGTVSDNVTELRRAFEAIEFDSDSSDESDDDDENDEDADANSVTSASSRIKSSGHKFGQEGDADAEVNADDKENDDDISSNISDLSSSTDEVADENNDDVNNASSSAVTSPMKRKPSFTSGEQKLAKKVKSTKRMYRDQIMSYYGNGSGFGSPVAGLMYSLASQLGRTSNDFLWFSILSATNNYIYGKSSVLEYTSLAKEYKDEVDRLSPFLHQQSHTIRTDNTHSIVSAGSAEKKADDKSIRFIEDFQLVLLRHWNLYDSLFHSTYVATKLGVWKEKGRQRLTNMLVKMGFPQKESRQTYKEMALSYKKTLPSKLADLAPKYNMPDILFPSFDRAYGYTANFSASDVVYSITALLDCGATLINQKGITGYEALLSSSLAASSGSHLLLSVQAKHAFQDTTETGDGGLVGAGVGTRTEPASIASCVFDKVSKSELDKRPDWVRHFYLAYDALSSPKILQHGILLAIHYQKLLVETAMNIIDTKNVKTLKNFQITILKAKSKGAGEDSGESRIFGSSVPMLYRLTSFLMDAYQIYRDRRLPFVCIAYNDATEDYLVLGRAIYSSRKNPFGLAFLEAAERNQIEVQHDFFDSSCIKVAKDDLEGFLETLQQIMI